MIYFKLATYVQYGVEAYSLEILISGCFIIHSNPYLILCNHKNLVPAYHL
jgi:hypothetical protein